MDLRDALERCEGVRLEAGHGDEPVYVPRGPWRSMTASEVQGLLEVGAAIQAHSVAVARVCDAALCAAWRQDAQPLADMTACISQRFRLGDPVPNLARWIDPPNRLTVSWDPSLAAWVGLHVDAWRVETRPQAGTDVCHLDLNIGPRERYFLFVPLSIDRMRAHLGLPTAIAASWGAKRLGRHFLERCPDMPVVRLRLEPGVAYVAPIERILHDGSSEGVEGRNLHLSFEGDIEPGW